MDSSYNKIWKIVLDSLSQIYSEVLMDLWLNRLELVSIDDKNAILVIDENEDLIDILNANYSQKISEAFAKALSLNLNVKIYKKGKYFLRGSEEEKEYLRQQEEEKAKEAEKTEKTDEFYFDKGEQRSHENEIHLKTLLWEVQTNLLTRQAWRLQIILLRKTTPCLYTAQVGSEKRILCALLLTTFQSAIPIST